MEVLLRQLIEIGQKIILIWAKLQLMVKDFMNGLNQSMKKAPNTLPIQVQEEFQEDGHLKGLLLWTI